MVLTSITFCSIMHIALVLDAFIEKHIKFKTKVSDSYGTEKEKHFINHWFCACNIFNVYF